MMKKEAGRGVGRVMIALLVLGFPLLLCAAKTGTPKHPGNLDLDPRTSYPLTSAQGDTDMSKAATPAQGPPKGTIIATIER